MCCVGSGLCDKLITRSEESYRVCACVSNCLGSRNFSIRRPKLELVCSVKNNYKKHCHSNQRCEKVKFVPVHAMKAYRGSRNIAVLILNLGTRQRWEVNSTFRREWTPVSNRTGGWVGPTAGFDVQENKKLSCPCRVSNPGPYYPQHSHNTDYIYLTKARLLPPKVRSALWCTHIIRVFGVLNTTSPFRKIWWYHQAVDNTIYLTKYGTSEALQVLSECAKHRMYTNTQH